jgi:hypothetical protein
LLWNEVGCLIGTYKGLKNFLFAVSVLFMSFNLVSATADAQNSVGSTAQSNALPNAPQPAMPDDESSQPENANSPKNGTGNISGTVVDITGCTGNAARPIAFRHAPRSFR